MSSSYSLSLSGTHHQLLKKHLLGDRNEAAAILFCRDLSPQRAKLIVFDVLLIPNEECSIRRPDFITWPGARLSAAMDRAEDEGCTLILIHSHPGGFLEFSVVDDESDRWAIGSLFGGWSGEAPAAGHGSAIMVASGRIRARLYDPTMRSAPVADVTVVGDDIVHWRDNQQEGPPVMAFGSAMTEQLAKLRAGIIGVSGTGSIIAEQAARMGFGALTLIDFDRIEHRNLNRILGSRLKDAVTSELKVNAVSREIGQYRDEIQLQLVPASIMTREAVLAAAQCDILFSCVDSAEGRQIADLIAQAFVIPLIDMGVTIPTRRLRDGNPAIAEVMGRIDYVQPFGSTLASRQVFTSALLRAEYLARSDPEAYAQELKEGYIKGTLEEAPSVLPLNMRAASCAMLEFVARMFPFRHDSNRSAARTLFALADGEEERFSEDSFPVDEFGVAGRGLTVPLLGLPLLGE
ncbi:ThiF family adenylyltransferase [Mesorhizobium silamurunense]|uniref:ThiF family adenylyltransferase n=1 Tax=Mesorhizobium silamurunense TaxID=499528 RepID=UPI001782ED19